jgi:hypothetical protein
MKDFKVYVGITEENLVEVLHGALKNDTTTETFPIRHVNNAEVCFPTRYIKIVPLSCVPLLFVVLRLSSRSTVHMARIFTPQYGMLR